MRKGIIAEINHRQGYGFIIEQEQGYHIRFNTQDLAENYALKDEVVFSILDLDPGRIAVNISRPSEKQQKAS